MDSNKDFVKLVVEISKEYFLNWKNFYKDTITKFTMEEEDGFMTILVDHTPDAPIEASFVFKGYLSNLNDELEKHKIGLIQVNWETTVYEGEDKGFSLELFIHQWRYYEED